MTSSEALALLTEHGAVGRGHFRLSSGLHSDRYVQCALVCQWPTVVERLGAAIAERFTSAAPTVVCSPAMGGVIIGHEVARALGVRMVFTERVDGSMSLRRGFSLEPSERVLVVEDVVTTGRSPRETIAVIASDGACAIGVGCIVDRSRGVDLGVPLRSLVEVEAAVWEPDECPLCRSEIDLTTPGSRHAGR